MTQREAAQMAARLLIFSALLANGEAWKINGAPHRAYSKDFIDSWRKELEQYSDILLATVPEEDAT